MCRAAPTTENEAAPNVTSMKDERNPAPVHWPAERISDLLYFDEKGAELVFT